MSELPVHRRLGWAAGGGYFTLECQVIYAIQAGIGPIKFGRALNPKQRLGELQTGNPEKLKLIGFADVGNDKEGLIHRFLRDERLNGEWFRPSVKTMAVARLIARQRFDAAPLLQTYLGDIQNRIRHVGFHLTPQELRLLSREQWDELLALYGDVRIKGRIEFANASLEFK